MSIVGTRVVRQEDQNLITAGGTYVDDLREEALSGAAHAVFVRSPIAHARIGGIDVSEALAAPGVLGVFTAADLGLAPHDAGPVKEPWLADGIVRYVGEPVALVLTEERYQLADAAELVDIDYDPLDAVATIDAALAGETLLYPETGSNVMQVHGAEEFDDALFDGCDAVVTQTIVNQRVAPAPLEVRGASCVWGEDGRLTAWLSTQNAQIARSQLAYSLGVGEEWVRVIAPDVGGGFGAKIGADPEATVLGWAAKRIGRAVRWIETRSENLTSMTHGRAQQNTVTIGGKRDGTVLAYRLDVVQDAGCLPADAVPADAHRADGRRRLPVPRGRDAQPRRRHQHHPDRRLPRRRPPGGDGRARTGDGRLRRRDRAGPGGGPPGQLHPARRVPVPDADRRVLRLG